MRSSSGMSGVISTNEAYAERSGVMASPPRKCSTRSMPMWIASLGFTDSRNPESGCPVTVRPW